MQRRYYTLDALRGVAAIIVLFGHSFVWLSPLPRPRAWLAVDLFFVLSGFVISKAYDPRFSQGMTARQFMVQRYVRLYPLFLVGIMIGVVSALLTLISGHGTMTAPGFAFAATSGLLMLPSPTWHSIGDLVPLDHPAWSLVYELGVNVVFACLWRWLDNRMLSIIVATSAILLALCYLFGDGFAGPSWTDAWMGVPRVSFGFFLGVLIGRHYRPAGVTTPWAWSVPLLLGALFYLVPDAGPGAFSPADKTLDALCVLIVFPALIVIGARFEPRDIRWMAALGFISYPLYVVHEPALYFMWRVLSAIHRSPERLAPISGAAFVLAIVWAAWGLALLDERLQAYIKPRLRRRSAVTADGSVGAILHN